MPCPYPFFSGGTPSSDSGSASGSGSGSGSSAAAPPFLAAFFSAFAAFFAAFFSALPAFLASFASCGKAPGRSEDNATQRLRCRRRAAGAHPAGFGDRPVLRQDEVESHLRPVRGIIIGIPVHTLDPDPFDLVPLLRIHHLLRVRALAPCEANVAALIHDGKVPAPKAALQRQAATRGAGLAAIRSRRSWQTQKTRPRPRPSRWRAPVVRRFPGDLVRLGLGAPGFLQHAREAAPCVRMARASPRSQEREAWSGGSAARTFSQQPMISF